ncbi:MAG: EAL domain-containing protein [Gammaproteobacteria bacterium]|nr:EAL domain-containing protein [Gammaproteobacteria bacterium]MBU1506402.1 EAL domain-containing protein [Gammaproteobacteria bacterium]MBU2123319.1 EAL domain-containing protein [Gammaproteobacteria bacterium]MBU2169648.1 EAL domain-containing protein [Gammaproteobacteria bacterium]MBU2201353.1 EAL domain-containing protein [Gammaproteobacteria bacterium]
MAKILVVDDLPANRALVVTLIGHGGHQALEASDGAEALVLVRAERPQLVISDILMPTMDGYEFVRQLRADAAIAHTQVVFYSAHYRELEARNLALACGVTQVLIKPCEPQDILDVIDEALAQAPASSPLVPEHSFQTQHLRLMTDKLTGNVAQLEAMNFRLAALTDLNLQLASERDPQVLLANVCKGARDLVGAQYAVLCISRKHSSDPIVCTSGLDAERNERLATPVVSHGLPGTVRAERRSQRWTDPSGRPEAIGLPPGYPPLFTALIVPVTSLSFSYGWICLANKLGADGFSVEDEKIVTILGAQVGRIYENGSLYQEVQRHAEQLQVEVQERQRAMDALRASKASLRRAQSLAKIVHVISGPDGAFESWLDTLPEMLGLSDENMPRSARAWLALVHPDDRAMFRRHALEASNEGVRLDFTYRLVCANGQLLHLRQVMEPLDDEVGRGQPRRWFNTIQDITKEKRAEEELHESDRRFNDMLDKVEMISLMLDSEGRIIYCNDYLLRLTGWQREEVFGRNWFALFLPPDAPGVREVFADLLADRPSAWHYDNEILTRSGERRLVHWNNTVLRSVAGDVTGVASLGEDVTERREAERKIKRLNRVYAMLSGINTLIVRVRERDELFRESCRVAVEHGQFRIAWIGKVDGAREFVVPLELAGADGDFLAQLKGRLRLYPAPTKGESLSSEVVRERRPVVCDDILSDPRILLKETLIHHGAASMAVLPLMVGHEVVGVLTLFADEAGFFDEGEMSLLTELAGDIGFAMDHLDKEERLSYLAYYDEITGLPNRTLFLERCSQHLRPREGNRPVLGIALMDISRFRIVNDTLGRQMGDELLKQVAQRLQRAAGDAFDVARIGINSFGIAVPDPRDAGAVAWAVDHLMRACFDAPFALGDTELRMAAKGGVALYPMDGMDAEALLRNAEAATDNAKASADRLLFYTSEMNTRVAEALSLEGRLREALEQGQFVLHYQPKQHLASGAVAGAEALIRWNDPLRGLVPPGEFIPILEETGLIYDVGRWALRQALADNQRWRQAGLLAVRVAVNVSSLQLRHRGFIAEVRDAIASDPYAASGLELEITESMLMDDVEQSTVSLHALRDMGITVAIDDFGTGFSSLSYLAKLPVDTLKIDRSFITGLSLGPQGLALVSTIINLGHSLGLKVVAEGVETEDQSRMLALLGCDEIQGYLLSRPVPAAVFEAQFLRSLVAAQGW